MPYRTSHLPPPTRRLLCILGFHNWQDFEYFNQRDWGVVLDRCGFSLEESFSHTARCLCGVRKHHERSGPMGSIQERSGFVPRPPGTLEQVEQYTAPVRANPKVYSLKETA